MRLTKCLVPFIGYRLTRPSLPMSPSNSLLFIRYKQDLFSILVNIQGQSHRPVNEDCNTILSLDKWSYSKDMPVVRNAVYSFDLIGEEKKIMI